MLYPTAGPTTFGTRRLSQGMGPGHPGVQRIWPCTAPEVQPNRFSNFWPHVWIQGEAPSTSRYFSVFRKHRGLPFTCFYCLHVMDFWLDVFFWQNKPCRWACAKKHGSSCCSIYTKTNSNFQAWSVKTMFGNSCAQILYDNICFWNDMLYVIYGVVWYDIFHL